MLLSKNTVLMLLSLLSLSSCYYRIFCDASDSINLGWLDYSPQFLEWEDEFNSTSLTFSNDTGTVTLLRSKHYPKSQSKRYTEYVICIKLDIAPSAAYAYYEYENKTSHFQSNHFSITMMPYMLKMDSIRTEVLWIRSYFPKIGMLEAVVPTNGDKVSPTQATPRGKFIFKEQINLKNITFKDIWVYEKEEHGIYYSKDKGIIAIKIYDDIYIRD